MLSREIQLAHGGYRKPFFLTVYVPYRIQKALTSPEFPIEDPLSYLFDSALWKEYLQTPFLNRSALIETRFVTAMIYGTQSGSRGSSPDIPQIADIPSGRFKPLELPIAKVLSLNTDYTEGIGPFGLSIAYDCIRDVRRDLVDRRDEIIEYVRGRITPGTRRYSYVCKLYARMIDYEKA
ncbi:MAG: hypothetical protein J4428_05300 [Candidatus Aenigmarchaeota archaeon]|nr:hypothetical protein [Candidatus Aenigmarchaeota archaeon]